jgi:hypothetical protein
VSIPRNLTGTNFPAILPGSKFFSAQVVGHVFKRTKNNFGSDPPIQTLVIQIFRKFLEKLKFFAKKLVLENRRT